MRLQAFGGDAELAGIKNAIERFNKKYPNVEVVVSIDPISTGWGDYVTKVIGQFTSGSPADVYGTAIETFQAFSARGLFMPLDDFIKANPSFSDFAPSLFEHCAYKGVINYIPIGWNNIMVNYNRDLFDKAGLAYPKRGWTWDEFRDTAKKLTVKDSVGNTTQFGYEVPNQNFSAQSWFFSNGTSILNKDWTASNMLDPKVAETLQFLHDLIHVDGASPIPGAETMDNQFVAGQVAMISRGQWIVQNAKANKVNMDIAIPPKKTEEGTIIGFGAYAIAAKTEQPDLAKALVLELTSEETQREQGERGGGVPGRKSAASTEAFLAFPPSAFPLLRDAAVRPCGAFAGQLPGGREDLHSPLHGDDVRPGNHSRRLPGSRRRTERILRPTEGADGRLTTAPGSPGARAGGPFPFFHSNVHSPAALRRWRATIEICRDRSPPSQTTPVGSGARPGARRLSVRVADLRPLPHLRFGAGGTDGDPELLLLRPDARIALGRS